MQSAKETASNIAASAKAGMDKTKATVQEKAEKMTTRDPMQKEMATQKKEQRIDEAEMKKQEARGQHAAAKHAPQAGAHTGHHTTAGTGTVPYSTTGHPTGNLSEGVIPHTGHHTTAGTGTVPYSTTGHPAGNVSEGVMGSHPVGAGAGTGTGGPYDATMRADAPRHADRDSYT